jgi:hypothetical protein
MCPARAAESGIRGTPAAEEIPMARDIIRLLDPARWTVTVLPLPKRMSRASSFGLCGGFAVGRAEGATSHAKPHWWPHGQPELLAAGEHKRLSVHRAHDREIPGAWSRANGSAGGALGWRLSAAGALGAIDLHDPARYAWTIALAAGGGCFAGYGQPKLKKGQRAVERALFWRADGTLVELAVDSDTEAMAEGTDGTWVVGRHGFTGSQRAALWNADTGAFVSLGPTSEAYGVRDGEQAGCRFAGMKSGAALWKGSAASCVDLTPKDQQAACARDCAQGLQVGYCHARIDTRGGTASMAVRAALWAGTAASHVDLQAFVPAPWNASSAWAIEVSGGRVRIAGEATQFGVEGELTRNETHTMVAQAAIVWEAELG